MYCVSKKNFKDTEKKAYDILSIAVTRKLRTQPVKDATLKKILVLNDKPEMQPTMERIEIEQEIKNTTIETFILWVLTIIEMAASIVRRSFIRMFLLITIRFIFIIVEDDVMESYTPFLEFLVNNLNISRSMTIWIINWLVLNRKPTNANKAFCILCGAISIAINLMI